jgi:hypothetical protein
MIVRTGFTGQQLFRQSAAFSPVESFFAGGQLFRQSAAFPPVNSFASWQLVWLLARFCQLAAFLPVSRRALAGRQCFRLSAAFSPTGSFFAGRRVFRRTSTSLGTP